MIDLRKRVAIFISSMRGGGAQRVILNLAEGMAKCGYAVDLLLARAEGSYLVQVPDSVRVVDLKARRVSMSLLALVRYLRREQPDAMLSVMAYVNIIALWAWRLARVSTRIVVSEHNTPSQLANHGRRRHECFMLTLRRCFYPWADSIIAVSKGAGDDLAKAVGIDRERIRVIYNPVVTPELQKKAQAPLYHPWLGPNKAPVLLAVGRLTPQKDFPTLIRAFAKVRQNHSVRLLILGEGKDRHALEALIRQLGLEQDVSMPGFVENPYPYMAQASLFILSSRWEGLPTVLIEAMSCGTPPISTDCPSGPREILADGKYGKLVPVGDVPALAQAIETALKSNVPSPPHKSCLPFKPEVVVDKYINILFGSRNQFS